ncbi:glycogen synthase [Sphingobacterium chuzhouense]|uniref:Glycogen synthase n=1 Tax=Sphingobacterium chuzhouense TaxID=1742264 RepID=A0ABR7XVC3_9SPHI|nr:glycogen/starch synthase [Sphingobacterium chuzhouense]MBD1423000.1 glycogen/starch synthase [Sphingobacterium chuzhouense]
MHVIHLSVECFPLAKVGGLADVVGALPRYQRKLGIDAWVLCPYYDRPFTRDNDFSSIAKGSFFQGSEELHYEVLKETEDSLGFPLYLIRIPGKLDRQEVYCYPDEAEQWIAFQHACLDWLKNSEIKPDVINCHDHHVGLIPFLTKHAVDFKEFEKVKTVFTVHNGQYQGWMNWNKGILLPAFDTWKWGLLDWDGLINPLAAAIKCCDAFTTVSEGYLQELYGQANGLESLFFSEAAKGYGIVNGIDDAYWNPAEDKLIPVNYDIESSKKGKAKNKKALCEKYGLDETLPLLTYIGRFATEKGADLLPEIVVNIFSNNENKISIFILGSGDAQIQANLQALLAAYPGRLAAFFGYNEALAHEVYAAADMILMPSRVEPCGLNQLYAMKYGTIPIVRGIGGLNDTVRDVSEKNGYGFLFPDANPEGAVSTIERALDYIGQRGKMQRIRRKEMELDFSWDKSAQQYINLYNRL